MPAAPALRWIHGGGLIFGAPEQDDRTNVAFARGGAHGSCRRRPCSSRPSTPDWTTRTNSPATSLRRLPPWAVRPVVLFGAALFGFGLHSGRDVRDHLSDRAAEPVGDLGPGSHHRQTPWARCETPPCRSASFSRDGGSPHEEAAFAPALPPAPGRRLLVVLGGVRTLQCGVDHLADLRELAYLLRGQRIEDGAAYGLDMAGSRTLQ